MRKHSFNSLRQKSLRSEITCYLDFSGSGDRGHEHVFTLLHTHQHVAEKMMQQQCSPRGIWGCNHGIRPSNTFPRIQEVLTLQLALMSHHYSSAEFPVPGTEIFSFPILINLTELKTLFIEITNTQWQKQIFPTALSPVFQHHAFEHGDSPHSSYVQAVQWLFSHIHIFIYIFLYTYTHIHIQTERRQNINRHLRGLGGKRVQLLQWMISFTAGISGGMGGGTIPKPGIMGLIGGIPVIIPRAGSKSKWGRE